VITVFAVETLLEDADLRESLFTESDYFFAASFPGSWKRELSEDGLLQYGPEDSDPVVSVSLIDEKSLQGIQIQKEMLEGSTVTVGGMSGYQMLEGGGNVVIYIPYEQEEKIVQFRFTSGENPNLEKVAFYKMLTGLSWISLNDEEEEGSEKAGDDGPIVYCGGIAKKLCPSGYRCELKSFEEDATGICVDASMPPEDISSFLLETEGGVSENEKPVVLIKEEEKPLTVTIPDKWKEYRRERLSYSFAIPNSWWWEERGGSGFVSHVVIATEEITQSNQIIFLDILPKSVAKRTESSTSSQYSIAVPRDEKTSFLIHGEKEYADQIKKIASSLSFL